MNINYSILNLNWISIIIIIIMCFRIRILIAILAVYATLLESIRRTGFYFILSIEFKNQSSNGLTNLLNSPDHVSYFFIYKI